MQGGYLIIKILTALIKTPGISYQHLLENGDINSCRVLLFSGQIIAYLKKV